MKKYIAILSALLLGLTSCDKKDENNKEVETIQKKLIATTTQNNQIYKLLADDATFSAGYNKVYLQVLSNDSSVINNADVVYFPKMDMMSISHSCPVESPSFNSKGAYYEGSATFTMASGSAGTWKMHTIVNQDTISFPIDVQENATTMVRSFTGTDNKKYVIALVTKKGWTVGMNDVEIVIYNRIMGNEYTPNNDFTIEMTPTMPSMDHGSPNNVNPTFTSNGHYKGRVNYTMTGDWQLDFTLKNNGVVIAEHVLLDIAF